MQIEPMHTGVKLRGNGRPVCDDTRSDPIVPVIVVSRSRSIDNRPGRSTRAYPLTSIARSRCPPEAKSVMLTNHAGNADATVYGRSITAVHDGEAARQPARTSQLRSTPFGSSMGIVSTSVWYGPGINDVEDVDGVENRAQRPCCVSSIDPATFRTRTARIAARTARRSRNRPCTHHSAGTIRPTRSASSGHEACRRTTTTCATATASPAPGRLSTKPS